MGIWVELGIFLLVFIFAAHQLFDLRRERLKREQLQEKQVKAEQIKVEQNLTSGAVNDTQAPQ